jgi:small-conductance mechanosensitive channel
MRGSARRFYRKSTLAEFRFFSYDVLIAVMAGVATLAALIIIKAFVVRQLHRLAALGHLEFLGYPAQLVDATRMPFLIGVATLVGISQLELPAAYNQWLEYAWIIVLMLQVALWANRLVSFAVERALARHRLAEPSIATHLMLGGLVARILVWALAVLMTLDNLGFNITTLMASLGIGGIAVALAVQNILGDIFSSISIALDKPFVIGDFIVVENFMGTVEYIGMKTTRLRSLGGEQIIFSNNELLKNRIRNYKRMQDRRITFEFGVAYETPYEKLSRIPDLVKEIVTSRDMARFDRAHFRSYGDSALQFEVVYYVLDPDYNKYMDIQQEINLALLQRLREWDVSFAYPTRTLYFANPPFRPMPDGKVDVAAHGDRPAQ